MNQSEIKHLGLLARLKINEDESDTLLIDLKKIIGYISSLDEVKITKKTKNAVLYENFNVFRDDNGKILSNETRKKILNQAPKSKDDYFLVRKII